MPNECRQNFFQQIKHKVALDMVNAEEAHLYSMAFLPADNRQQCYALVLRDFQRIYAALRDGQTSLLKTNFADKLPSDPIHALPKIIAHVEHSPNSRTTQAWLLLKSHYGHIHTENTALVKEIYEYSFLHSMLGAQSNLLGQSIFRTDRLKKVAKELELCDWEVKLAERTSSAATTRTGKIVGALLQPRHPLRPHP